MAIHGDIRKKLRVDCGVVVEVAIELDEESREPVLPPVLVLHAPKAQRRFRGVTTALRRQIVRVPDGSEVTKGAGTTGEPVRGPMGAGKSHDEEEGAETQESQQLANLEQTWICVYWSID
jgi:hypothetical protein